MKTSKAYFTVEASMVIPVVIGVILLTIYLWIFQYNRCLMEQDIGEMALKGSTFFSGQKQEIIVTLKNQYENSKKENYFIWKLEEPDIFVKKDNVQISQTGMLQFPFDMWNIEPKWQTEVNYRNQILSPVSFLRNYYKLKKKSEVS